MATTQYWMGFLALCMAAVFAVGLGSFLQYRAIAHQQVTSAVYAAESLAGGPHLRRASF